MKKARITKRFVDAPIIALALFALVSSVLFGCGGEQIAEPQATGAPTQALVVFDSETPAPTALLTAEPTEEPTPSPTPAPTVDELIDRYIESMSLETKLGQLVMFGFLGQSEVSGEFEEIIEEYQIGNVIFYGANVDRSDGSGGFDTMAGLVEALDAVNPCGIPRLYSIDVEGGDVHRFIWDRTLYGAYELGSMSSEDAEEQFIYVGQRLRGIGINLDLAPVMDISKHPLNTFLGTRIISSDPETAGEIGSAAITGLHEGGCLSTAKHFPGHGGTNEDSHKTVPVVNKSLEELMGYDLLPFAAAVDAGVDCVLVAHISYPALDDEHIASLSPAVINGLLRGELGFEGIVISDDYRMQGLAQSMPLADAAVQFILSGGDIILCGAHHESQREIMRGLYAGCADGRLSEERVNESVHRVLYAKYKLGVWAPPGA